MSAAQTIQQSFIETSLHSLQGQYSSRQKEREYQFLTGRNNYNRVYTLQNREKLLCLLCVPITAIYRFVVCFIKFSSYLDCKLVYHLIRLSRSFHSNSLDFESSIGTVHANEHMFSFLCGTNSFCHLRQVIYSRHLKLRSDALYGWTKCTSFQHYSTELLA